LNTPLLATGKIQRTDVVSAKDMYEAVMASPNCDLFFGVAAVADWAIANPSKEKIKRQGSGKSMPNIAFTPNPDILLAMAQSAKKTKGKPHPYCVGFAAESTKLEEHADDKRKRKGIPLIVGNIGPDTFGSDLNQLLLIHERGSKKLAKAPKLQLARQLIQFVATQL
jgi:phosphopantothenoylcysteine decarboxylase/phosphopantothenate--cysteine ligase